MSEETQTPEQLAKQKLRAGLPHLRFAAKKALEECPGGAVFFMLGVKTPDGKSSITASFEVDEFLNDLETVVGCDVIPEKELEMDRAADLLLEQCGMGRI